VWRENIAVLFLQGSDNSPLPISELRRKTSLHYVIDFDVPYFEDVTK
jgi:hypothetical protein